MGLVLEFLRQHLFWERSVGLLGISSHLILFTQRQLAWCHIVRPCRWYFRCLPLLTSMFLWSGSGSGVARTYNLCMLCSLFEENRDNSHSDYKCLLPSYCLTGLLLCFLKACLLGVLSWTGFWAFDLGELLRGVKRWLLRLVVEQQAGDSLSYIPGNGHEKSRKAGTWQGPTSSWQSHKSHLCPRIKESMLMM